MTGGGGVAKDDRTDEHEEEADELSDDSVVATVEDVSGSHGEVTVSVEGPSLRHISWDEWQTYFDGYCVRTLQVLRIKETMSRDQRIKRLLRTKKGEEASQLIPPGVDTYQRTYIFQWNTSRKDLEVKHGRYVHNHSVSKEAFATYQTSRGVDDELITSIVGGDDNAATARELAAFAAGDKENVSSVADTASGETRLISRSTAHMRRIFSRFSELLLIDCSHKTNRYNYQLLTFMNMNEFGDGAVVQHSLIEANDLNEIRVLENHFPETRVLICHFHVIKYWKEMRANPEFGKISSDDASQVDACVHKMVDADSSSSYETAHVALGGLCDRIRNTGFLAYFEKNWHTSQFVNSNYDEEMANVLRFTTPYDAGHVEKEYALAMERFESYTFTRYEKEGHIVHVAGGKKVWTRPQRELKSVRQFSYERFSDNDVGGAARTMLTQSQRYAEALRVTQLIASELADIENDDEFRIKYEDEESVEEAEMEED
ncbi:hypothetical protein PHMEG_00025080, partial [Phytophthora megakarya]